MDRQVERSLLQTFDPKWQDAHVTPSPGVISSIRTPSNYSEVTARWPQDCGQHSTHRTIVKSVHSVSLADKCTLKTTDYRLQTRPRSLDLIVSRHSQRGMVKPTLHKSTWPTFRSTSWIMRNSPVWGWGEWSWELMETRGAERWKLELRPGDIEILDIEEWKEVHLYECRVCPTFNIYIYI